MNGFSTILAIAPFGCVAIIAAAEGNSYLQYGALGLCSVIVVFLCKHIIQLTDKLDKKDKNFIDLCERNTTAYHRLTSLLEDRPCLMNDKRIKE
jgi:hypothetical protein